jgi:hypothetical protein
MKASEVVKHLEEGKLLGYTHKNGEMTYVFLLLFEGKSLIEVRGWQSSPNNQAWYVKMMVIDPKRWSVVTPTKEHTWYDEKYQMTSRRSQKINDIKDYL